MTSLVILYDLFSPNPTKRATKKYFKVFGHFIKHIEISGPDEFDEFHMADLARNEPNPTQKFLVVLNLLAELLENDEMNIKHFSLKNFGKFTLHLRIGSHVTRIRL